MNFSRTFLYILSLFCDLKYIVLLLKIIAVLVNHPMSSYANFIYISQRYNLNRLKMIIQLYEFNSFSPH